MSWGRSLNFEAGAQLWHPAESGLLVTRTGTLVKKLVQCRFRNGFPRIVRLAVSCCLGPDEGNRSIQAVHQACAKGSSIPEQSVARHRRRRRVASSAQEVVLPKENVVDKDELQSDESSGKLEMRPESRESLVTAACRVQERLQFLRELGLSEANLAKLQSCSESSIRFAILKHSLKSCIHVATFLTQEVGCSGPQAALCLFDNVYLASSSVDGCLRPKVCSGCPSPGCCPGPRSTLLVAKCNFLRLPRHSVRLSTQVLRMTLSPQVQYLQGLGFSNEQMVKFICRYPRVLTCHMERHVQGMTRTLIDVGLKVCRFTSL